MTLPSLNPSKPVHRVCDACSPLTSQQKKTCGLVKSCSAAQVPKMPDSDGYNLQKKQNGIWVGYNIWTWNSKQPFFLMDVWWNKQFFDVKIWNHPTETTLKQNNSCLGHQETGLVVCPPQISQQQTGECSCSIPTRWRTWQNLLRDMNIASPAKIQLSTPNDPCIVYLLTFTIKKHLNVGKYTIHGSYGNL